jgi:hypothetical protein
VAKASAAEAAAAARRTIQRVAARVLHGTANPDGPGLLVRGQESQPLLRADLDSHTIDALMRLARLAGSVADALRDCPDPAVRRSAAILAARAHPLRAAFDD